MASERSEPITTHLMEEVVRRENLQRALKRVRANKGSPGIDGMTIEELVGYLREQWSRIREELLRGDYQPQPVKEVLIPKPGGGTRQLGIPTVLDRLIEQALLQVLTPIFDPTFSAFSYGFRPGRNAHQAVCQAKQYIAEGYEWVVDIDLRSFRQGQPRHSDGEAGQADRGQEILRLMKCLTAGYGSWGGAGEVGRNAARRPLISSAQ
jgi:retron-type reverse transcriptase